MEMGFWRYSRGLTLHDHVRNYEISERVGTATSIIYSIEA